MTTRTIIFAISDYYGITLEEAKDRYHTRINDSDYEGVLEVYLNKSEEE